MTDQNDFFGDPKQAQAELRDGIESSLELVRKSRQLIELSESARADEDQAYSF